MRGMKQPRQRCLTASGKVWRAFVTEVVYRILFFEIYKGGLSTRCMGTCKAVLWIDAQGSITSSHTVSKVVSKAIGCQEYF